MVSGETQASVARFDRPWPIFRFAVAGCVRAACMSVLVGERSPSINGGFAFVCRL